MNTRKTVYNKLFKEETKLATHEVELGMLQDFEKLTNSYFTQSGKFEQSVQKIETAIETLRTEFINNQKVASSIDSEYQKFRKSALDLGVQIPVEVENNYKRVLALLKNDLETFKKYNK